MIKRLQKIGRGRGVLIEKSLLDHLEIGDDDLVELVPSAGGLLLRKAGSKPPSSRSEPLPFDFDDRSFEVSPPAISDRTSRSQGAAAGKTASPWDVAPRPPASTAASGKGAAKPEDMSARSGPSTVTNVRAWVDGGSRGNPGPAGYGAHIEDGEGHILAEKSGYLGVATNNVAEYQGLLAALRAALELGAREVEVMADSELMVRQMNGRYQVKNEALKKLFAQAKALAERIPKFTIKHVPREKNRDADRLANEAMDRGE